MLAGRLRPSAPTYDAVTEKLCTISFSSVRFIWCAYGQMKSSDGPKTCAGGLTGKTMRELADGKIPLKDLQEIYDEAFAAKLIPSAVPVAKVMDYTWVDEVLKEKR